MSSLYEEISAPPAGDVPVRRVTIDVNGQARTVDVEPRLLLAHLIRQGLKLTGTHTGCDTTSCGACTVLFDGRPIKSCTMFAVQADGHKVETVEIAIKDKVIRETDCWFHLRNCFAMDASDNDGNDCSNWPALSKARYLSKNCRSAFDDTGIFPLSTVSISLSLAVGKIVAPCLLLTSVS